MQNTPRREKKGIAVPPIVGLRFVAKERRKERSEGNERKRKRKKGCKEKKEGR
jgi:hypothetical protein